MSDIPVSVDRLDGWADDVRHALDLVGVQHPTYPILDRVHRNMRALLRRPVVTAEVSDVL